MRPVHCRGPRYAGWLVAALLLIAQWGALAHQLEHQAHPPHAPCLVCVGADQFGNALPTQAADTAQTVPAIAGDTTVVVSPARGCALAFRSRAPPLLPRTV